MSLHLSYGGEGFFLSWYSPLPHSHHTDGYSPICLLSRLHQIRRAWKTVLVHSGFDAPLQGPPGIRVQALPHPPFLAAFISNKEYCCKTCCSGLLGSNDQGHKSDWLEEFVLSSALRKWDRKPTRLS